MWQMPKSFNISFVLKQGSRVSPRIQQLSKLFAPETKKSDRGCRRGPKQVQCDSGEVAAQWEYSQVRGVDTNICRGFEIITADWPTDVKLPADGDMLTFLINILSVLAAGLFSLIDAGRNKSCKKNKKQSAFAPLEENNTVWVRRTLTTTFLSCLSRASVFR